MDWEQLIQAAQQDFADAVGKEVDPAWSAEKRYLVRRRLQSQLDVRLAEIADQRKAEKREREAKGNV